MKERLEALYNFTIIIEYYLNLDIYYDKRIDRRSNIR